MVGHQIQLGVIWSRGQGYEQLVLDVALSRADGLRWLRVLLLGLILYVSCIVLALIKAMDNILPYTTNVEGVLTFLRP